MQDNGYESYTPEAYAAVMKYNGSRYEDLSDYQKRRYHCATVLYEFQQSGSYTFRHKKAEEAIQGGLKADIESFMEYRKSLLQAENTQKQYRLDLLRFNIFLDEKRNLRCVPDYNRSDPAICPAYMGWRRTVRPDRAKVGKDRDLSVITGDKSGMSTESPRRFAPRNDVVFDDLKTPSVAVLS